MYFAAAPDTEKKDIMKQWEVGLLSMSFSDRDTPYCVHELHYVNVIWASGGTSLTAGAQPDGCAIKNRVLEAKLCHPGKTL